jgi:hypothetical protein
LIEFLEHKNIKVKNLFLAKGDSVDIKTLHCIGFKFFKKDHLKSDAGVIVKICRAGNKLKILNIENARHIGYASGNR